MKIGFTELILVAIVAFVVIGPDKLPEYARKLGKMLRELKKYTGAASEEIQKNVVEPLNEIQAPIKEAVAPLTDIKKDIDDSMKDVTKSFTNIGKTSKEEAKKAEEVEEVAELEDTVERLDALFEPVFARRMQEKLWQALYYRAGQPPAGAAAGTAEGGARQLPLPHREPLRHPRCRAAGLCPLSAGAGDQWGRGSELFLAADLLPLPH